MSSEYSTEEDTRDPNACERRSRIHHPLPLWRLFREALLNGGACRDIVEKHVMCKLNGTDLKFFYEVNTETRKLVKRSSRAGDLKKRFRVSEMSSISTLEVAWENKSLWPSGGTKHISAKVAETNKLELLKWAREEKKCKWDERTINAAAEQGNLEMVKYCVANKCPIDGGRVHMLPKTVISRYSNTYAKKSKRLGISYCLWAAENGHLHILEYLVERKYDKYDEVRVSLRPRTAT